MVTQANKGRTLIEKFEAHADVAFVIVLLAGDDRGGKRDDPSEDQRPRARQNVILELGYFFGKLGRDRVCAVYAEDVELPSDVIGISYVPLNDLWKWRVGREMQAAGLDHLGSDYSCDP